MAQTESSKENEKKNTEGNSILLLPWDIINLQSSLLQGNNDQLRLQRGSELYAKPFQSFNFWSKYNE